jgi:predicted hydrocarbon binding protein
MTLKVEPMSEASRVNLTTRTGLEIPPVMPLALLESVRAHDRPGEILEDEDLSVSLPRRLGLTGVVERQMMQYQQAAKKGRKVSLDDVASLIHLVLRRPDSEPIMRETGQRIARTHFQKVPKPWVRMIRALPRGVVFGSLRRSARRMLVKFLAEEDLEITAKPLTLRAKNCVAAQIDPSGNMCVMYSGALEEIALLYTETRPDVVHHICKTRGNSYCEWTLSE